MAVMTYYNALGRGASVDSGNFIVPGSNVSADPDPLIRWYDYDTIQATYSYNNGEYAQWFDGKIGITRLYSSALTSTEVLNNYNADKSKYGL